MQISFIKLSVHTGYTLFEACSSSLHPISLISQGSFGSVNGRKYSYDQAGTLRCRPTLFLGLVA
jgi:hypothetical protein